MSHVKKTPFATDGFSDDGSQKTSFDEDPVGYKLSCHMGHDILKQLMMTRVLTYITYNNNFPFFDCDYHYISSCNFIHKKTLFEKYLKSNFKLSNH